MILEIDSPADDQTISQEHKIEKKRLAEMRILHTRISQLDRYELEELGGFMYGLLLKSDSRANFSFDYSINGLQKLLHAFSLSQLQEIADKEFSMYKNKKAVVDSSEHDTTQLKSLLRECISDLITPNMQLGDLIFDLSQKVAKEARLATLNSVRIQMIVDEIVDTNRVPELLAKIRKYNPNRYDAEYAHRLWSMGIPPFPES